MRVPLPDLPGAIPPSYPSHRPVTAEISRDLDRRAEEEHRVPSFVLMEHASRGVATLAAHLAGPVGSLVVLCGPGNNGGDGYGTARFLTSWGASVRVLRCSRQSPHREDAALEVTLCASDVKIEDAWADPDLVAEALRTADVAIDALFGVGLDRDLDLPFTEWIAAINAADVIRLAVDVPSGLDGDTGQPRPVAVHADVTATMAMPKTGLVGPGAEYAGQIIEIDIGLPGPLHREHLL